MNRLLLFALVLLVGGCEDSVDPTLGVDAPFSIYGYLDPTADSQAIRIAPIVLSIEPTPETLDAAVTSTDLATGAVTAWRDSLVTFPDESRGHIFVADYTPTPGTNVRIEARRSDGAVSSVEVAVPAIIEPSVSSAVYGGGDIRYEVSFSGAPRVLNGQLRLLVSGLPATFASPIGTLIVPTTARPREVSPGEWVVEVPFLSATRRALGVEGLLNAGLELLVVDYVGFVTNEAWALPSEDPDVLVEPGIFSNVEGGLGFIGAGYRSTARWVPTPAVMSAAGFTADVDDALVLNEVFVGLTTPSWAEIYNPTGDDVDLRGYSLSDDQANPRKLLIPTGTIAPAGGFVAIDLPFQIGLNGFVEFYDRRQEPLSRIATELFDNQWGGGVSFGSYPDGARFRLAAERTDLFLGPLTPTKGAPNEFGYDVAAIHEVFTEGTNGFVELVGLPDWYRVTNPVVFDNLEGYYEGVPGEAVQYGVAPETPSGLRLGQSGGEVYLAVRYHEQRLREFVPDPPPGKGGEFVPVFRTRVVDIRRYGPQVPGRSVGYFPDLSGGWAQNLRPTPGAPNASARLGL